MKFPRRGAIRRRRTGLPGADLDFLRAILDTLPDHIYVKDLHGRYLLVNAAGLRERGLGTLQQIVGKTVYDVFPREVAEHMCAEDRAIIVSGEPLLNREARTAFPGVLGSAKPRWHLATKTPMRNARGEVIGILGINRDITERKLADRALCDSEETFRAVFDQAAVGITLASPELRYLRVNNRFCEMLGYTREELLAMTLADLNPPFVREDAIAYRLRLLDGSAEGYELREKELLRKDGTTLWVGMATSLVRGAGGEPRYFVSVVQDISEAKRAAAALREREDHLRQLAHCDPLTQLPNRVLFYDRLAQILAHAARNRWAVGVMYIDIDRFKRVNDEFGHAAGDLLLHQVSARLARAVRSGDTVARIGGDEFAVVLSNLSEAQDAGIVAQKIVAAFEEPFLIEGRLSGASVSVGVALAPQDGGELDVLMRRADAAMYRAKAAGRNCYRFYQQEMNARALEIHAIESQLRRALADNELVLRYQPRTGAARGEARGAEAWLAWARPGLGMIGPDELLPLLAETSLLPRTGAWVLDRVCAQLRQWAQQGPPPIPVTVKVSARQFMAPGLGSLLSRSLAEHRVDPCLLEIEVPEAAVTANPEAALTSLRELKSLGVACSLGGFGAGHCSLAGLRRLPIDALSIERSYLRGVPEDADAVAVTRAAIALAHALGLRVVAAGVENEAQRAFLAAHGCDQVQGSHVAPPLPPEELVAWLAGRRPAPARASTARRA